MCLILQENTNMKGNISLKVVQPCIAIMWTLASPVGAFLCVEKTVVSKLTRLKDIGLTLIASFYAFNMHYTLGLTNFYILFECFMLNQKMSKGKTKLVHLMTQLHNIMYRYMS